MSEAGWGAPAPDPWGGQPAQPQGGWGGQEVPAAPAANHTPPSQEEYLSSESVTSFSFDGPVGTMVDGIVTSAKIIQKIDFDTKKPAVWDDGSPKWTLRVLLQTLANEFQDDDGIRAVYYDYKKKESLDAAFRAAGVKAVVLDDARLRTRYSAGGPKDRNPNATKFKTYDSIYNPPGSPEAMQLKGQLAQGRPPTQPPPPPQQDFGAAAQPHPADLWKGLNQAAVDSLSAAGYGPQDVLPYIQDRPNWQGAPADVIRGVLPPPAAPPAQQQAAWSSEPPF